MKKRLKQPRGALAAFPKSWGHRGYSSLLPENTLASFGYCVARGVGGVELDVQLCKSGEVVVFHDDDLERVTGYKGLVRDTPYSIIERLQVDMPQTGAAQGVVQDSLSSGETYIPTLGELFHTYPNLYYDIELKGPANQGAELSRKVSEIITQNHMEKQVVVSSFNPLLLRKFRKIRRDIPTAVIWKKSINNFWVRYGLTRYMVKSDFLKPHVEVVQQYRARNKRFKKDVLTWTENSPKVQQELIDMGIRVISDTPVDGC